MATKVFSSIHNGSTLPSFNREKFDRDYMSLFSKRGNMFDISKDELLVALNSMNAAHDHVQSDTHRLGMCISAITLVENELMTRAERFARNSESLDRMRDEKMQFDKLNDDLDEYHTRYSG